DFNTFCHTFCKVKPVLFIDNQLFTMILTTPI
ncbi:MAG: hypothetical protein ACI85O_002190, partial [Saprospiraceae bacterium]